MLGIFGNLMGGLGNRSSTPDYTYSQPAGGFPDRPSAVGYGHPTNQSSGYSGPGSSLYNLAGFGARGLGLLFNRIFGNSTAPTATAAAAPAAGAAPPLGSAPAGSGNITSINPIFNYDRGRQPWQSGLSGYGRATTQDVRSKNII